MIDFIHSTCWEYDSTPAPASEGQPTVAQQSPLPSSPCSEGSSPLRRGAGGMFHAPNEQTTTL